MNYYQKQMADSKIKRIINMSDKDTLKEVKEEYGDENYLADKMRGIINKAKQAIKETI